MWSISIRNSRDSSTPTTSGVLCRSLDKGKDAEECRKSSIHRVCSFQKSSHAPLIILFIKVSPSNFPAKLHACTQYSMQISNLHQ